MRYICRTTRRLIVAGLLAGLSLTGLPPDLLGAGDVVARASSAATASTKCCCGTEDGRCCGTGCCAVKQTPKRESCPCPAQRESRDGQQNPLALGLAKLLAADDCHRFGLRFADRQNDKIRAMIDATLQATHVRIDA